MSEPDDTFEVELDLMLEAIFRRYHYDFRDYSRASLRRRLTAALGQLGDASLSMLQHRVLRDPALFSRLLGFLTVQVSDLFRDPPFYAVLRERVIPLLGTYPSIRVWSAGCATGEETYSVAILLEEAGLLDRTLIYGTDISPEALQVAERGIYEISRVPAFSKNYLDAGGTRSLSDYYAAAYDAVRFDARLRSRLVLSDHSLATDAVFAEVQLVLCRNVLIYFDRALQDRAVGLFRDALPHGGLLALGSRESLRFTAYAGAFEELDATNRIYQRVAP